MAHFSKYERKDKKILPIFAFAYLKKRSSLKFVPTLYTFFLHIEKSIEARIWMGY